MKNPTSLTFTTVLLAASSLPAATLYVSLESTNPTPPYTSWQNAARVIQDAVEAAAAGDQIVVTNGTYATGGRTVGTNVLVNRVAVDKPLAVRSVNGPQFTVIQGDQVSGTINGSGAIRCVYLASGASLSGFTLTNGATRQWTGDNRDESGGGVWCDSPSVVVSNCVMADNSSYTGASGAFGGTLNNCTLASNLGNGASGSTLNNCVLSNNLGSGASSSTLNNCILIGNSGGQGGGASYCTLTNCTLTGNTTYNQGGGAISCTLYNCMLSGNSGSQGGGSCDSTLYNCTLSGNSGWEGGGAWYSTLNNCILSGNTASWRGGGAFGGTLNGCGLIGNSASSEGGGADYSALYNCTLTGNSVSDASGSGGGAFDCALFNCLLYFNTAPDGANYDLSCGLNYCCTTPLPTGGAGNSDLDPLLASASHLSSGSPCRDAGSAAYATGTDIDGESWGAPPSIGCDEYHVGAVTGALSVSLLANYTNVAVGYPVGLTAVVEGRTTGSVWDFGDGMVVSNRPYASHAWAAPGDYAVVLRTYNESLPGGVAATVTVHVAPAPTYYVSAAGANPQPPYATWPTAATTIQDAVDAALLPGALVVVTNGTYSAGGRALGAGGLLNRVAVDKPLVLRSVNGPRFTVIQGANISGGEGSIRCVYLTDGASLFGFTLTNGVADSGGGVWAESAGAIVSNCVLAGNQATNYGGGAYGGTLKNCTLTGNRAGSGGGAYGDTLNGCALTGNSASSEGGGACGGTLYNCTLTGNSVSTAGVSGGGAFDCALYNCILFFNTAPSGTNYDVSSGLNYCCTTPLPAGTGNTSLDPQLASASHLSAGSPCRGAGSAAYATGTDIDGEPWGIPPSIGCDEYHAGAVAGLLSVAILAPYTNFAVGHLLGLTAAIEGRTVASVWDFGDGVVASNWPCAAHAWSTGGDYTVVLRAYNESHPEGVAGSLAVHVTPTVYYVLAGNPNPVAPYTNWATAAQTIQDAVDADVIPGAIVLVGDGQYSRGGRTVGNSSLVNRVAITRPLAVRSVNGPQFTFINGGGTNRCASLADGASLSGFTLTNGYCCGDDGAGVWCASREALLTNCVIVGGLAAFDTSYNGGGGGGVCGCALFNCTLTRNSAGGFGGGAVGSTLNGCTISGNSADSGGGARDCTLNNCVVTGNGASGFDGNGGGVEYCTLTNCTVSGNSAFWGGGGAGEGSLYNCVVSGNHAYYGSGGGAGGCTLYSCTLTGNYAYNGPGGGASACNLYSCTLSGNSASYSGGAAGGTLYNCTVSGNSAGYDGGVGANYGYPSTLYNCIVYYNTAQSGSNYGTNCTLNYCCTTPLPPNGVGIITKAPLFVDYANGNLRLQSNSPCINAGNNAYVTTATDLDGKPRIVSGTVDIGAYEYQGTGSVISYAWLQQYGLPTDGTADYADPDHDGLNNWQEWVCGTDPTNALSALRMVSALPTGTNTTVTWQSVAGVNYFLERSATLASPFTDVATNILGQAGTTIYADTNATGPGPFFYRVEVKSP